jgi:hypothetical protein
MGLTNLKLEEIVAHRIEIGLKEEIQDPLGEKVRIGWIDSVFQRAKLLQKIQNLNALTMKKV